MTANGTLNHAADAEAPATVYRDALARGWKLVAAVTGVAVAVAMAYCAGVEKRYEARADLLVSPVREGEVPLGLPVLRQNGLSLGVVTVARLIETEEVTDAVNRMLGVPAGAALPGSVEIHPQQQSGLVSIVATASSPDGAAQLANGFADAFLQVRQQALQSQLTAMVSALEGRHREAVKDQNRRQEAALLSEELGQLARLLGADDPSVASAARALPPGSPAWPRPLLVTGAAGVAGVLVGAALALVRPVLKRRVVDEEELTAAWAVPVLARTPRLAARPAGAAMPARGREAFRLLRVRLGRAASEGRFPKSILVSSPSSREGKTTTAIALAESLATTGLRVVLVDGDLRQQTVSATYGRGLRRGGLGELFRGEPSAEQPLAAAPDRQNLWLLLAGPGDGELFDQVDPARAERVFRSLEAGADVVVVDGPSDPDVSSALMWADLTDTVVVTVRLGVTRRDRLDRFIGMLIQMRARLAGFVVVDRRRAPGIRRFGTGRAALLEPRGRRPA